MPYFLDTNAISELSKPTPNNTFITWFEQVLDLDLYTSCTVFGEIYNGIERLSTAKKRTALEAKAHEILAAFENRILIIDTDAALLWANLMAYAIKHGSPTPVIDTLIAAQCLQHKTVLVTRNVDDFKIFEKLALKIWSPW